MPDSIQPVPTISVGDLVVDNRYRIGIVVSVEPSGPSDSWLHAQHDPAMRDPRHKVWWNILPISGGAVMIPEGLLRRVGPATHEDVQVTFRNANKPAREMLANWPQTRHFWFDGTRYCGPSDFLGFNTTVQYLEWARQASADPKVVLDGLEAAYIEWRDQEAEIERLVEMVESVEAQDALDEMVYETAQAGGIDRLNNIASETDQEAHIAGLEAQASDFNNEGAEGQIRYLIAQGVTVAEIDALLGAQ